MNGLQLQLQSKHRPSQRHRLVVLCLLAIALLVLHQATNDAPLAANFYSGSHRSAGVRLSSAFVDQYFYNDNHDHDNYNDNHDNYNDNHDNHDNHDNDNDANNLQEDNDAAAPNNGEHKNRTALFTANSTKTFHTDRGRWNNNNNNKTLIPSRRNKGDNHEPATRLLLYIIPLPEITDWLIGNYTDEAYQYYQTALNEDQAELWLYRSLQQHSSRTLDPTKAHVFVICGCLHLNYHLQKKYQHQQHQQQQHQRKHSILDAKSIAQLIATRLVDAGSNHKPHVLAVPTTNPGTSRFIGIKAIVKALTTQKHQQQQTSASLDIDLWSLGFERNKYWQRLPPEKIIPVPYVVVNPPFVPTTTTTTTTIKARTPNFVFYAGDRRIHAKEWSGCDRSMVAPLAKEPNMFVRLMDNSRHDSNSNSNGTTTATRITQKEYNQRMRSSEYCLILCGDSPTSRSLTSAMVHGCIPLFIGTRLKGSCEPPCHPGWGWTVSGASHPHLPYYYHGAQSATNNNSSSSSSSSSIPWDLFPEIPNESQFQQQPAQTLQYKLASIPKNQRQELQALMRLHSEGFIYGWGNPVNSTNFGGAHNNIWESIQVHLRTEQATIS